MTSKWRQEWTFVKNPADITNNICNKVRNVTHMMSTLRGCKAKMRCWSEVRQWSYSLMLPLHCLWDKLKNRTRGQFECDRELVLLLFWFLSFTCTVRLLFHSSLERQGVCGWGEGCSGRFRLKLDVQGQGGGKILDVDGREG